MDIGSPIEEQAVMLWRTVYGNIQQSMDEARGAFWQQNPAIIDGWERLARSVCAVTTKNTLSHITEGLQ